MTRMKKKEVEERQVREFLTRMGLSDSVRTIVAGETPDFRLTFADGTTVGIELVELANGEIAAGQAGLRRLSSMIGTALRRERINVHVNLRTTGLLLPNLNLGTIEKANAAAIVDLARAHVAAHERRKAWFASDLKALGVRSLSEVVLTTHDAPQVTSGVIIDGRAFRQATNAIVAKKSALISSYRAALPDTPVWLLMVGGCRTASGTWSEDLKDGIEPNPFDRVFYLDYSDNLAFEVFGKDSDCLRGSGQTAPQTSGADMPTRAGTQHVDGLSMSVKTGP
jgi:hypothetical protein